LTLSIALATIDAWWLTEAAFRMGAVYEAVENPGGGTNLTVRPNFTALPFPPPNHTVDLSAALA
jgi:hypothetical protein